MVKRPIAFYSTALTPSQYNWPTGKQEAYAIVSVLLAFAYLLNAVQFTLKTDHKNLEFIKESQDRLVMKWRLQLQDINCKIEYIKGDHNEVADALSRMVKVTEEHEVLLLGAMEMEPALLRIFKKVHSLTVGHRGFEQT